MEVRNVSETKRTKLSAGVASPPQSVIQDDLTGEVVGQEVSLGDECRHLMVCAPVESTCSITNLPNLSRMRHFRFDSSSVHVVLPSDYDQPTTPRPFVSSIPVPFLSLSIRFSLCNTRCSGFAEQLVQGME